MFIFYTLWYVGNIYVLDLEKICEGIKLRILDLVLITSTKDEKKKTKDEKSDR